MSKRISGDFYSPKNDIFCTRKKSRRGSDELRSGTEKKAEEKVVKEKVAKQNSARRRGRHAPPC
ncbi:hypothetical protein [Raoultella sp. T31]|uniref:hypothetical protein n=1 Tax=Raoultella sp. T31 TaxID=2054594 RepID=UPI00105525C3